MLVRLSLLLGAAVYALAPSATVADDVRVIMLAGQSNMVGSGTIEDIPPDLLGQQEDVRYAWRVVASSTFVAEEWSNLRHFAGTAPVGVSYGPEISFGRVVADALPEEEIAILKIAQNGTSLTNHWDPVSGFTYNAMFEYADAALQQLVDEGLTPVVDAFVWVQGTGDARSLDFAEAYDDNLRDLMEAIRTRYSSPELPLVFNQIHAGAALNFSITDEEMAAMRDSQNAVASDDARAWLVDVDDLELRSIGDVHYSGEGLISMGRRLADVYLTELHGFATADFSFDGVVDEHDLEPWSDNFSAAAGATRGEGDANGDGRVDGIDFLIFQQQFHSATSGSGAAVPEPLSGVMGIAGAAAAAAALRRRQSLSTASRPAAAK